MKRATARPLLLRRLLFRGPLPVLDAVFFELVDCDMQRLTASEIALDLEGVLSGGSSPNRGSYSKVEVSKRGPTFCDEQSESGTEISELPLHGFTACHFRYTLLSPAHRGVRARGV